MRAFHNLLSVFLLILVNLQPVFAQPGNEQLMIGKRLWRVPQIPLEKEEIIYKDRISLAGFSKDRILNAARHWLEDNFPEADLEWKKTEQEADLLSGRAKIHYRQKAAIRPSDQTIHFTFEIKAKPESYSYELKNFTGSWQENTFSYSEMLREELKNKEAPGTWTHKVRYELLSDFHSLMTLFVSGLQRNITNR